jgi:hypothetical protein
LLLAYHHKQVITRTFLHNLSEVKRPSRANLLIPEARLDIMKEVFDWNPEIGFDLVHPLESCTGLQSFLGLRKYFLLHLLGNLLE